MSEPTEAEIEQAAAILSKLEPGKLPLPIFLETTRLTVTPILEVVPLRLKNSQVEVLLLERDKGDPIWGGMLHTPGTVIRANDKDGDFTDAFDRIFSNELGNSNHTKPVFVDRIFHQVKRGREIAEIYYVEMDSDFTNGKFYEATNLPKEIVDTQIPFITKAVNKFKTDKELL
jgi:hypothetical protein